MELDPETTPRRMSRTISGLVVPRPIGWVSIRSTDGVDDLAPFSFFDVGPSPPIVVFCPGLRPDGLTHTDENVRETGEFVVDIVAHEFGEAMNETSASVPNPRASSTRPTSVPSTRVDVPRVAGVAWPLGCERYDFVEVGSNTLVLVEVVYVHVRADTTTDGDVDTAKLDVVGRLAGNYCDGITDGFRMERPD